jgi:hypothetical protein
MPTTMISSTTAKLTLAAQPSLPTVPALARANVFVVTDPERDVYLPGEEIEVLPIL